jgi:hypothetical protein
VRRLPEIKIPGFVEASGVIAGAGATLLVVGAALGWGDLPPKAGNSGLWWLLLWATAIAAMVVILWALLVLLTSVWRGVSTWVRWAALRSPFEFRSPVSRKEDDWAAVVAAAELGFLDYEQFAQHAMKRSTARLDALTKDQKAVGDLTTRYTPRFQAASTASTDARVNLSKEYARRLYPHARRMERHEKEFRASTDAMATNWLERFKTADVASLQALRPGFVRLRESITESRASQAELRAGLMRMRAGSVQQALNAVLDKLVSVADATVLDFDAAIRFATQAVVVIDDRIVAEAARLEADAASEGATEE